MRFQHSIAVGAGLLTLLAAREAAAVECSQAAFAGAGMQDVPVLYIENGDTQEPLLKRFGKALMQKADASQRVRIVYRNRPTCELADNFYTTRTLGPVAGATARPIAYIPDDPSFDITAATSSPQCTIPAAADPPVQLAIGATFLTSCGSLSAKPADTTLLPGPNQAYGFIANNASSQQAITAEEGYFAFGFTAATGMASPWLDMALRLTRGATASTTLTTSANIGLTPTQMVNGSSSPAGLGKSQLIVDGITAAADVQAAIGALGGDLYDSNRGKVKLLAFKAFKQKYAYFPDATSSSFEKINVRDGHYLVWSPTQYLFVHGTDPNTPTDATVARVVNLLFGETQETDVNGLDSVAKVGLVPQCAMKVQRSFDGGDLQLYSPAEPCGCFFESAVPSGVTACTTCTTDSTCGTGKCRHGYCEAK